MDVTRKIGRSFADEHVIGVDPPMRPELPGVWRRRMNPFTGRAVSDKALTAEQDVRSGMQRIQGLALAPGSIEGLEIVLDRGALGQAPDDAFFQVAPGLGLARSGEDVGIGAARRMSLGSLPVILRADHEDALEATGEPVEEIGAGPQEDGGEPAEGLAARLRPALPRRLGRTLAEIAGNLESKKLPHAGIIVAQPVTATILGREMDDCPPDPRDEPYADLQRIDGCRLALFLWPSEMSAIGGGPDYALPASGPDQRNRLAYSVFDNEKLLLPGEMHPWEEWGVPVALVGFEDDWGLAFVDRFAVARTGGTPRARTPIVPATGDARLWQARIDQFVGQLSDLPSHEDEVLRKAFVRMPPVGLLPPEMFDPKLRRQHFFPGSFGVSAVPVPHSNLDLAIREAAPLASFNRGVPDRVELLVPVPDSVYDPGLLEVAEEDPRFAETVKEFLADRAGWLTRREVARRRYDRLMETVSGQVMGWTSTDLPLEENSPAPHVQVPVEVSRTRLFKEQSAARLHSMSGAHATLPVTKSDTIWVWVRIHSAAKMTGLSLRIGFGTKAANDGPFFGGVFWGAPDALPIFQESTGLAARRRGDLPEAGVWHRLEIPASVGWLPGGAPIEKFSVNAVEFGQRGGEVEWGSFGKIDASGKVYTYIGDDVPAGAALRVDGKAALWPWLDVPGREALGVPDFGTVQDKGVRRAAALDAFRAEWSQDFLAEDLVTVDETGLSAFLNTVEARLKATNDAIDLGFVRARADIYRVRQIMLGADAASRLVTSPALADLASRDEGARATSKGISEFLVASAQRAPEEAAVQFVTKAATKSKQEAFASARSGGQAPPDDGDGGSEPGFAFFSNAFFPETMTLNIGTSATAGISSGAALMASAASTPLTIVATGFQTAASQPAMSISATRIGLDTTRYQPRDVRAQVPIAGLVERTVSVAERLQPSPAVQALSYAIASKAAVLRTLKGLVGAGSLPPKGIALGDLLMPGFKHKTEPESHKDHIPTLSKLLADRAAPAAAQKYIDADEIPSATGGKHESDYFTNAVQAIDNSIAIMRLVEGRVSLFEALTRSICDLRDEIMRLAGEAAAWLRTVDVEVAEARHDLAVAERLRAEEAARIEAVNTRRAAILATHVGAIGWRRVREADNRSLAPLLEVGSGLALNPIVACRRDHEDVPDEIEDYVELLRDAPVKWFPPIAAAVDRIDRLEAARAAIEKMRERAALPLRFFQPVAAGSGPKLLLGVHQALSAQRRVVEERRAMVVQVNLAGLAALSLAQTHIQIRETASLGDLIGGRHRQPALTRMASEEIDGISQIAGCLHAGFGEVAPVIRLGWAEILSEFDRPAPLESLSGLPGWPEVPMELRRTLQSFVDWLFSRIDRSQAPAKSAINELVRVAMLMAADAPVDKIIPARLVAPVPARIGHRLQLALDVTRIRKGMTALIRDRDDRIVSRAVIDDVIDGHASAVIVQNLAAVTTISADMRFHLVTGPA